MHCVSQIGKKMTNNIFSTKNICFSLNSIVKTVTVNILSAATGVNTYIYIYNDFERFTCRVYTNIVYTRYRVWLASESR